MCVFLCLRVGWRMGERQNEWKIVHRRETDGDSERNFAGRPVGCCIYKLSEVNLFLTFFEILFNLEGGVKDYFNLNYQYFNAIKSLRLFVSGI